MPLSPWFGLHVSRRNTWVYCHRCAVMVGAFGGTKDERTAKIRTACGEHDNEFHPNEPLEY